MSLITDQTGFQFSLEGVPLRIVSTVPSQTELLFDLGLGQNIVGVTAYCVHPQEALERKEVIGGTKDLNLSKILGLQPDLIIGNKEENIKEQIEELRQYVPVWLSDIKTIDDGLGMIKRLGGITESTSVASNLIEQIEFERLKLLRLRKKLRVAYFIWKNPMMMAGPNTFIGKMLEECGFINVALDNGQRYPQVPFDRIYELEADLILLSSEPYAFTAGDAHHISERNSEYFVLKPN